MAVRIDPEVEIFANALDECLATPGTTSDKRDGILRLVDIYHDCVASRLEALNRSTRQDPPTLRENNEMELDDTEDLTPEVLKEELRRLEGEARVWDLLRRLLPIRYPDGKASRSSDHPAPPNYVGSTNLWRDFLKSDPMAIERAAVLEWLQYNALSGPDINDIVRDLQQNADRGDIIAHGWLHTRSAIKLRKSVQSWHHHVDHESTVIAPSLLNSVGQPLVTQLDPDSITRQGRRLQPQDEYFERAIWRGCFELLRRGTGLDGIRDWCLERTEVWRSVSMSALPNLSMDKGQSPGADPKSLALWRRTCFALARDGGTDDFERAVYGLLSGDIPSVERVCGSWDDLAFAHYNSILRTQFDAFILSRCPTRVAANLTQSFAAFDGVHFHGDPTMLESSVVKLLETDARTSSAALDPMMSLQTAIIAKNLDNHLFEQGLVLAQHANTERQSKLIPGHGIPSPDVDRRKFIDLSDHSGLRIMSHLFIILTSLDSLDLVSGPACTFGHGVDHQQMQENLVAAYVSFLRLAGLEELIPLYCSRLASPRLYHILSRNLIHITEHDERLLQLNLIRKAGLDPLAFVRRQPQIAFDDLMDEGTSWPTERGFRILHDGVQSIKYGRLIKSDFFGEEPDTLERMDELMIRSVEWLLLVDGAWSDALAVGNRVYKLFLRRLDLNSARAFSARVPFSEVMRQKAGQPIQDECDASWFENVDLWDGDALVALDARNFWELESLVKALDTMETLASLAELSREEPAAKREFWAQVGNEVKAAKVHIRPLLKNWLLVGAEDDADLQHVRDIYLPETILAYISVLHFAGTCLSRDNLLESMELAAVIAEKDSDIATIFVKCGRMKELLEAFASCSKALAIVTGEKKGGASSNKKLREMGWSRDLWSVRP